MHHKKSAGAHLKMQQSISLAMTLLLLSPVASYAHLGIDPPKTPAKHQRTEDSSGQPQRDGSGPGSGSGNSPPAITAGQGTGQADGSFSFGERPFQPEALNNGIRASAGASHAGGGERGGTISITGNMKVSGLAGTGGSQITHPATIAPLAGGHVGTSGTVMPLAGATKPATPLQLVGPNSIVGPNEIIGPNTTKPSVTPSPVVNVKPGIIFMN